MKSGNRSKKFTVSAVFIWHEILWFNQCEKLINQFSNYWQQMESKNKIFFQHKILGGTTGNKSRQNSFSGNNPNQSLSEPEETNIAGNFGQNDFQSVSISEGNSFYGNETKNDNMLPESTLFSSNSESNKLYEWFDTDTAFLTNVPQISFFRSNTKSEMINFSSSRGEQGFDETVVLLEQDADKAKSKNVFEKRWEEKDSPSAQNQLDMLKENLLIKKNLQQLQKANEELVELNRSKNELLSIISHDLKNPFGALLNMSEFLATETDDLDRTEIGEFSQAINISAKILYKFFNDLLEWSKLQNGIVNVNPVTLDVRAITDNIFSLLSITAMSKGVRLVNNIPRGTNLLGDLNMVNSIINNLVTNAIKFTNAGGSVIVQAQELDGFVELAVVDDGVGMGENVLEKIFKLNKHFTNNGTENEIGSGLGLVITKDLITRHGGKIRVESKKGTGTSFFFTLPKENIFAEVA